MVTLSLNDSLKTAIQIAQSFARENYSEKFSLPHLLRGLLHKEAGLTDFLKSIDKDISYMQEWAEIRMEDFPRSARLPELITADDAVARVLEEADNIRLKLGLDDVSPICVLAALVKPNVGFTVDQLKSFPLREKEILDLYLNDSSIKQAVGMPAVAGGAPDAGGGAARSTNALLKYCVDKTSLAREGKVDPIVGRDKETRMMLEILGRRSKPNVIIIGEPGVGKTALVEGFALALAEDKVPDNLKGAMLFELDMGALAAGASYKGEVEDRLKNIIREIKQFDKAVLFIDEIHTLLDPKGPASGGAANLLKPELARGEITVIGASTNDEYRKIIEPEQAFNRRFETLRVEEPDLVTATKMMEKVVPAYEAHHSLQVRRDVLAECVRLAKRYVKDRRLPDAAIDLLDRTMAAIRMMNETSQNELIALSAEFERIQTDAELDDAGRLSEYRWFSRSMHNRLSPVLIGLLQDATDAAAIEEFEALQQHLANQLSKLTALSQEISNEVTKQEIAAVVSYKTGIPIGKIQAQEQQKLLQMEDIIKRRVVGQDGAVKSLSNAIVESRSGLNKPGQPIGSFFLLGPTGTGKTEITKSLADFLFNDEKAMIRFDMSEFKEEHSAALLYGAPPGYVGYEEGGMLVNKIRAQPYSVVLFDEIEKAHPSVFDIFLQILDEGKMHDRLGKEGDFSNALIIFTSNIGSEWIVEQFNTGVQPKSSQLMEIMARHFRPEFLARLTEIVPFAPISEANVVRILEIQMKSLLESLDKQSISLEIDEAAKKKIALTDFTPKYGARQISGVIRTHLRRPLSRLIVSGEVKKGSKVRVHLDAEDVIQWQID
ncbi:ATP-dependent Clp protease ATP-binding subunit [Flaviaesturariibacter amylovorans]|uniref:ATP-dependent Clp protease ATP-binding subunit n=1 Tax=Flaviaesturariibacter amylovorans TaxID=1084520 RepID=A0ABP8HRH2_9BACT